MSHGQHDPVQRVNAKHADELLAVARSLGGHPEATSARATRIDSAGIDLLLTTPSGPAETRVTFTEPISDPKRMRAAFRDLTRRADVAVAAKRSDDSA